MTYKYVVFAIGILQGLLGSTAEPTQTQACLPPHDKLPFCDATMSVHDRILDLISRINDTIKPNLLTARGHGGNGHQLQAIPELGVPAYYWGTNCLHSLNQAKCVTDSHNVTRCPTNFPSGPSFGATFDRSLIESMANVIGVELRASISSGSAEFPSLDCWGPVINLNRDPRWGRNGEGGLEDAYAMGELAAAWVRGFQSPRPSLLNNSRTLLQGIITLKHMAVNSLENTAPFNRHNFDANSTFGVTPFVLADYYFKPFKTAIQKSDARGVMCSYNSVMGVPTCLSPVIHTARKQWGFNGYVTSDSDSVNNAWHDHKYVATPEEATALALEHGQCDIDSGDTYNDAIVSALHGNVLGLKMSDVDRALYNTFKQRFDLGLFDPLSAYHWPSVDDMGSDSSWDMTLKASQEALVILRNDDQLLPLKKGKRIAVIGPHAFAQEVLMQPYPSVPFCADRTMDCISSPADAIRILNAAAGGTTTAAQGCDLFNASKDGFAEALELARQSDYVVLGLGIETCGMTKSHNVNPKGPPGHCYQEKLTTGYVFPDEYLELEAHDRTNIDLPAIQHELAKQILALGKPTVIFLMNAGAVAIDVEAAHQGAAPLAIIEAFYPGPRGGEALAQGIFGEHNKWGRLPYTIYPSNFTQEADMVEHDLRVAPGRTYRYYRTPTFPFGHGLSLTNWSLIGTTPACLSALSTTPEGAQCSVSVTIRNTGTRDGDAVIMAYFTSLSPSQSSAQRNGKQRLSPLRQLFDFQRLSLASGASETLVFNISASSLAGVDEANGDVIIQEDAFKLVFDDGGANQLQMSAKVVGARRIIDPFPASAQRGQDAAMWV